MKMTWEAPKIEVQPFVANEYVAACGDTNTVYKFVCDAGNGAKGDVYTDDGRNLTSGSSGYFHACNQEHYASTTDEFLTGYFIQNEGNDKTQYWDWENWSYTSYDKTPVIIWTDGGTNVHATTNLNINTWETAKS